MGRVIAWAAAGVIAVTALIAGVAGGVIATVFHGSVTGEVCPGTVTNPSATPAGLTPAQARNATIILTVGERMRVPVRGWVIAIAAALQESDLVNIRGVDQDSLGLFQQRP